MKTCLCKIQNIFSAVKNENIIEKKKMLIFLFKTLIVHTGLKLPKF